MVNISGNKALRRTLDARDLDSRLNWNIRINDASNDVWVEQKQKHAEYSIKGSSNYRQDEGTRCRREIKGAYTRLTWPRVQISVERCSGIYIGARLVQLQFISLSVNVIAVVVDNVAGKKPLSRARDSAPSFSALSGAFCKPVIEKTDGVR